MPEVLDFEVPALVLPKEKAVLLFSGCFGKKPEKALLDVEFCVGACAPVVPCWAFPCCELPKALKKLPLASG